MGDRGLQALEDAGAVPGPELPCDHLRPAGNGRSDRPKNPAAYADTAFAGDIAAVLDATGTERALLAAFCSGFPWALLFAAEHAQRVTGIVTIAPTLPEGDAARMPPTGGPRSGSTI